MSDSINKSSSLVSHASIGYNRQQQPKSRGGYLELTSFLAFNKLSTLWNRLTHFTVSISELKYLREALCCMYILIHQIITSPSINNSILV